MGPRWPLARRRAAAAAFYAMSSHVMRQRQRRTIVSRMERRRAGRLASYAFAHWLTALEAAAERLTAYLQPGELVAATDDGRLRLRLRREDRDARPERLQAMAYHALEVLEKAAAGAVGPILIGGAAPRANGDTTPSAATALAPFRLASV